MYKWDKKPKDKLCSIPIITKILLEKIIQIRISYQNVTAQCSTFSLSEFLLCAHQLSGSTHQLSGTPPGTLLTLWALDPWVCHYHVFFEQPFGSWFLLFSNK